MGSEIEGDSLGEDYRGYIFRITGGNDKEGFTMKQGVLKEGRVRLHLKGRVQNHRPRRVGAGRKKSVRGCITGQDLSVISLSIREKGEKEIPGLTDTERPNRLGPKRVGKIRKLFGLDKEVDVRKFIVCREVTKGDKTKYKRPVIQRLVTERRIRRKKQMQSIKKDRFEASKENKEKYEKVLSTYIKEKRTKREADRKEKEIE